jgi:hypothetical protein
MLKMNSACIIQCAAIDPHLFNDGGRIGGNEFRVRRIESLLAAALQSTRLPPQQQLLGRVDEFDQAQACGETYD